MNFNARVSQVEFTVNCNIIGVHVVQYGLCYALWVRWFNCVVLKFLLFFRVHHVLTTLGLSHFLCYGSLWGQIRISRSLPWEADVEFCLLNEELAKNDEVFLVRTFKKHNLLLIYNSGEGLYFVKDPAVTGSSIQLIVFEEDPMVKYYSCSSLNASTLKS